MNNINVVAAIIKKDEKILCVQRPKGGEASYKWEFPGGKIEKGESHKEALIREIREELDCDISVGELVMTIEHQYEAFHLTMHCYDCRIIRGKLTLHEHIDSRWLPAGELKNLDWAPADWPIIDKLNI